jgi:hypothetical protein
MATPWFGDRDHWWFAVDCNGYAKLVTGGVTSIKSVAARRTEKARRLYAKHSKNDNINILLTIYGCGIVWRSL